MVEDADVGAEGLAAVDVAEGVGQNQAVREGEVALGCAVCIDGGQRRSRARGVCAKKGFRQCLFEGV